MTIGGNITIGDAASDTIQITAGIESDVISDGIYNLDRNKTMVTNYTLGLMLIVSIDDNYITTTDLNADLQLRANGTGDVVVDDLRFNTNTIRNISGDMILNRSSQYILTAQEERLPFGTTVERPKPFGM